MSKKLKRWRHYEVRQSGECAVADDAGKKLVSFDLGIVETGNSRVFAGYFITIRLGSDEHITGEDEGSLIAALWRLARNISARGLRLRCAGLSGQFRESGLSENTGFGYFGRQQKPTHMMDDLPSDADDDVIDRMIREAVEGMRIGLA
jgi:hypothetical protein